jgi:hypothetical protein
VRDKAGFTQAFYSPELESDPKIYLKHHLAPTRLSYFSIAYNNIYAHRPLISIQKLGGLRNALAAARV